MKTLKQTKKPGKTTFEKLLEKVDLEEYQKFIHHYALKNNDFKLEFEVYFSDKDENIDVSKKYADLIQKLIRGYSDHGFIDYRSAFGFSEEVDRLMGTGYDLVGKKNFRDAFLMTKPALREMMEVMNSCDDSSGSIGQSVDYIIQLIKAIAEANKAAFALKEEIFTFLQTELADKLYFDYGDFGYDLFDIYQKLAVKLGKTNEFLSFVDARISKLTGQYDNYRREFLLKQKIEFYKTIGKPEEVEKLISQNLDIVEVRQTEVHKAIDKKDFVLAKNLIAEGIRIAEEKKHPGTVSRWEKELLRIAALEQDTATVRYYTKHFAFDRGFDATYYNQWKKTYSSDQWKETIEQFIKERTEKIVKEHKENKGKIWLVLSPHQLLLNALAPVYIQEKYWDRLLVLVKEVNDLGTTLRYHAYLVKKYPADLLEIYLPAFERQGDQASGRREYADLAGTMKKVIKDIPESKEKIRGIAQNLIAKYSRRPAMIDELNKILG